MDKADVYEIYVSGNLTATWQAWFEGIQLLSVRAADGQPERTLLLIPGGEPETLFGVLAQIGALNLHLISVEWRPVQATA